MAHKHQNTDTDYYQILGISSGASTAELKKAYRQQALKYHPDRNPGNKEAEENFKSAAEAYEILSDREKRKIYDRYGMAGLRESGYRGPGNYEDIFGSFSDIFGDIFGFGGRQAKNRKPEPTPGNNLRYDLNISFVEAVRGVEKEVEISKGETCWTCEGTGLRPGHQPESCQGCNGLGQVLQVQGPFRVQITCPHCHGQGRVITEPCNDCQGRGLVSRSKKVNIKIPAGVDSGSRMCLRGEGEGGRRGGPSGDLYVIILVEPHNFFHREGAEIFCTIPISFTQAALGCTLEVPTIYGKEKLTIPPGTQPEQQFILKKQGVTRLQNGSRGDMTCEIRVVVPSKLTNRQWELLRKFAASEEGNEESDRKGEGFLKKFFHL